MQTRYAVASKARKAEDSLHYAAQSGNVQQIQHLLRFGAQSEQSQRLELEQRESSMGMMPLHVACEHGQLEVVKFLVEKGVCVGEGDSNGITPMHLACIGNSVDICSCLLGAGAAVASQDAEGDTPLHWAATKGHCKVIELLLQHHSPVDPLNHLGWTPLHRAAFNGRRLAVESLAKHGASLVSQNQEGNTPLHLASQANQIPTIQFLLSLGAEADALNARDQSPHDLCITDTARNLLRPSGARPVQASLELPQRVGVVPGPAAGHAGPVAGAIASADASRDCEDGGPRSIPKAEENSHGPLHENMRAAGQPQGSDLDWVAAHVASSVGTLRLGTGPALPPVGSSGAAGFEELQQDLINDDNKHTVEALVRKRRPTSSNKRFLEKYSLDRLNLFAPAS